VAQHENEHLALSKISQFRSPEFQAPHFTTIITTQLSSSDTGSSSTMDYSSSEGAAAVLNKGYLNKVPTTTTFNNHSDDIHSKFDFVSIAKTFCSNSPQQRTLHYNGNMASNISDVLRSNKRTSMSMMMNAANPLDMFVGSNNNIAALPASGFARRLSAMNSTATASVMANAAPAASLRRPLKRIKLEGSCGDDGENVVAPPTVVLIPAQQHVMAFAEHQIGGSEDSNGDDAASHESLDHRSGSPGQGETLDGASGVRFREYQAEIWSEKFEELCLFRREHGHCHVPHHFQENQGENQQTFSIENLVFSYRDLTFLFLGSRSCTMGQAPEVSIQTQTGG
jgi:hypothetical protein